MLPDLFCAKQNADIRLYLRSKNIKSFPNHSHLGRKLGGFKFFVSQCAFVSLIEEDYNNAQIRQAHDHSARPALV